MSGPDERDEADVGEPKPFVEHLDDLRRVIVRSGLFLLAGILVAIPLTPRVLTLIKQPLYLANVDPETFLQVLEVSGGFAIAMRIVFWTGVILSLPFIVYEIGRFIFPGLKRKEQQAVLSAALFAGVLFVGGVVMGYVFAVPTAIQCLLQINDWLGVKCQFVELTNYVVFVLQLLVCFGLAFELPVVILALGAFGLVTAGQLATYRRHAVVVILFVAMVATPSTDALTMAIMGVPMVLLYELCVWVLWFKERRPAAAETAA